MPASMRSNTACFGPIGRVAPSAGDLEGVGDAENNRVTGPFHDPEIEGVDDQVVVPEGGAAFAKKNFIITASSNFLMMCPISWAARN